MSLKSNEKVLYDVIMSYLHINYMWGGNSPLTGMDCSGVVIDILKTIGELPNKFDATSNALFEHYSMNGLSNEKKLGSLCFYGQHSGVIRHVGIMVNDEMILEAGGGTSKTKTLEDAIKHDARTRIRPYDYRKDLVEIILPDYEIFKYNQ